MRALTGDNTEEVKMLIVKMLIAGGSKVNAMNEDGWTALMLASHDGQTEAIKVLIAEGAEVNVTDKHVLTLLMPNSNSDPNPNPNYNYNHNP